VLSAECSALEKDESSVFVAIESVYSVDGTIALLHAILNAMDQVFTQQRLQALCAAASCLRNVVALRGRRAHGAVGGGHVQRVLSLEIWDLLFLIYRVLSVLIRLNAS
jgi:hypothetical protein